QPLSARYDVSKANATVSGKKPLVSQGFFIWTPEIDAHNPVGTGRNTSGAGGDPPAPDVNDAIIGLRPLGGARQSPRPPSLPVRFESGDPVLVAEGQGHVVESFHEAPAGEVVELERPAPLARTDFPLDQVD